MNGAAFVQTAAATFAVVLALPVFLVLWKSAAAMGALQKTVGALEGAVDKLTTATNSLTTMVAVHASEIDGLKNLPIYAGPDRRGTSRRHDDTHP